MQACEELMLHGQAQFLLCHHHAAAPGRFGSQFRSVVVGRDALARSARLMSGAPRWSLSEATPTFPTSATASSRAWAGSWNPSASSIAPRACARCSRPAWPPA
jgi:hypothetical protein